MHVLVSILPLPGLQSDSAGWTQHQKPGGASVLLRVHTVVGGKNKRKYQRIPMLICHRTT